MLPISYFHVLARHISHHSREVARCWVRVSTLSCCDGRVSNIAIAGYGEIQFRTFRGSANGWTATKTIITTTHTLSTVSAMQTQWD
jgi:hypothetical protein